MGPSVTVETCELVGVEVVVGFGDDGARIVFEVAFAEERDGKFGFVVRVGAFHDDRGAVGVDGADCGGAAACEGDAGAVGDGAVERADVVNALKEEGQIVEDGHRGAGIGLHVVALGGGECGGGPCSCDHGRGIVFHVVDAFWGKDIGVGVERGSVSERCVAEIDIEGGGWWFGARAEEEAARECE